LNQLKVFRNDLPQNLFWDQKDNAKPEGFSLKVSIFRAEAQYIVEFFKPPNKFGGNSK
jgi:hypothetical protein